MKRALSILLILAVVFAAAALTACGDKEDSKSESQSDSKRTPDGETFELKDQDGAYTFSLQAYKDASLTYKMEDYSDRKCLVVTSDKAGYSVYVYINNGYKNNYDAKHESGKEDGGMDIKAGDYNGYTYPMTALNAAFFDTAAEVENEADIITMVVEQVAPFEHDINEVVADTELIDLLATLTLVKTPMVSES